MIFGQNFGRATAFIIDVRVLQCFYLCKGNMWACGEPTILRIGHVFKNLEQKYTDFQKIDGVGFRILLYF